MNKLIEIKEELNKQLYSVNYDIYEYKDQLKTCSNEAEKIELKKELSYLTGKAISLRETLILIDNAINGDIDCVGQN